MEKICPLMSGKFSGKILCKKDGCAWFDLNLNQCAILKVSDMLGNIADILDKK